MELWQIFAILWAVNVWIFWILQKIEAESIFNRNGFVFYSHFGAIIIPLWLSIVWMIELEHNLLLFCIGLITNLLYVIVFKLRLYCLKYMTSSSYFINYKIFTSIFLLIFGQIIFSESISINEYIGIFIWFITFFLLVERRSENNHFEWYKTGLFFLAISVLISWLLWLTNKVIAIEEFHILTYVFYSWLLWGFYSLLLKWKDKLTDVLFIHSKKQALFLWAWTIVFGAWLFLNISSIRLGWDISIVFKIMSYSLFWPIIFSIIFYKEKVTLKKIIAFILTIISIFLFV